MIKLKKGIYKGYTYTCFDNTKSIFVHIPKAAGISVCDSLYNSFAGGHTTLAEYEVIFSRKDFQNYFKFAFVRNPWDRLFSAYTFLRKGGFNEVDQKWMQDNIADYKCFKSFVMDWLSQDNVSKKVHFLPQSTMLKSLDGNGIGVDFVGRYENLEEDFNYVRERIRSGRKLVKLNQTNRFPGYYKEYYDSEMIKKVELIYKEDLDLLGYKYH
ncbi:sulfotransferase family 2 domain-containing protein [Desulfosediminicola sp.]|uniref:sulfotransferase family 2 domain-containing protein n=1 Tax=Desulfosediminicola sp. TaxID=2886825 RepID=UPI003AF28101